MGSCAVRTTVSLPEGPQDGHKEYGMGLDGCVGQASRTGTLQARVLPLPLWDKKQI